MVCLSDERMVEERVRELGSTSSETVGGSEGGSGVAGAKETNTVKVLN